jgi:outer membrane protein assembly factor BamB
MLPPIQGKKGGQDGWRVGNIEADGTFRCFDARTGRTRWRLSLPTAISCITTGDVDGDGQPDFILSGYDGRLIAVTDEGNRGRLLWTYQFDAPVGTSLLADLNGDGRSELIVSVGDGNVYVLGP